MSYYPKGPPVPAQVSDTDGKYPECRSCRYYISGGFGAQCRYDRCPYRKKKGGHKSRRDRWEK